MFYNPLDCVGGKSGGSTILPGNDTKEKMWNYFIGKGFNDAQTAGILGNAFGESGFIISRASNSSYWGLFQWYWEYAQDLSRLNLIYRYGILGRRFEYSGRRL